MSALNRPICCRFPVKGVLQCFCFITGAGVVYGWGFNSYGELGDGSTIDRWAPVAAVWNSTHYAAAPPGGIARISAGYYHTLVLGGVSNSRFSVFLYHI